MWFVGLLVGAMLGAVLGALAGEVGGMIAGGFVGGLIGVVIGIRRSDRLTRLEARLKKVEQELRAMQPQASAPAATSSAERESAMTEPVLASALEAPAPPASPAMPAASAVEPPAPPREPLPAREQPGPARRPSLWDRLVGANLVAKVGVVILFFGVAFLLRYAYERVHVPIELRLIGASAIAFAMLAIGWRLRLSRRTYALILQGGGVGVLYLVIFGALRLFNLLPAPLAFALLAVIAAASAVHAGLRQPAGKLAGAPSCRRRAGLQPGKGVFRPARPSRHACRIGSPGGIARRSARPAARAHGLRRSQAVGALGDSEPGRAGRGMDGAAPASRSRPGRQAPCRHGPRVAA